MTPSTYSPLEQKKATPKLLTLTPTQGMSSIPMKRLPIAPPDQTGQTPPKEMGEVEEDTPSVPVVAEAVVAEAVEEEVVEVEKAEAEEALQAQEGDTTARTSCSVNTPTPSLEIAPKHESF
jgi:hypothetical protein